ncbi:MAG: hypothetical protein IJP55_07115, partial [Bacteroidales bacterium]|nr:hypothetical protein [Bacteroidales bacterium]
MKGITRFFAFAVFSAALLASCSESSEAPVGKLTDPLGNYAWESAQWISASDAPVVTGAIGDKQNNRAADGASWFVSTVANSRKVAR